MIDTNDSEFLSRIEDKGLLSKVCDAKTAAKMFSAGDIIGISGFTPCGYPKITMHELAERMKETPFQVDIWTGASTGSQIDTELVAVNGVRNRMPYQTNANLRKAINAGKVNYYDLHLSHVAQQVRAGFFTNVKGEHVTGPDFAVVEVCKIGPNGELYPTTAIGNSPVYVDTAKKVIVEVNTTQPLDLVGMADIYMRKNPPFCEPIPILHAGDRVGTPYIPCDPSKIVAIVPCDMPDVTRTLAPLDDDAEAMGNNLVDFLKNEVKRCIKNKDVDNTIYETGDGGPKTNCRPILLLHNVQTIINQNKVLSQNEKYKAGVFYKFPFHLYKSEGWDIEHIDSNTENSLNDIRSQREWLLNAYFGLRNEEDIAIRDDIKSFFQKYQVKNDNEADKKTERDKDFDTIYKQIAEEKVVVSKQLSQEEKNKLWNFTLLDASTNRSYGNAIYPAKRRVIIGKEQGKKYAPPTIDENGNIIDAKVTDGQSSFIPPCTKYVFMKYYDTKAFDPNTWNRDDAEAYLNDIKETLKQFLL